MKTNTTLHTYYILINVAYCRNLRFMGDIVHWVVVGRGYVDFFLELKFLN